MTKDDPPSHADVIRDITSKFWRCSVAKFREGMREAEINGMTKVLAIMTPVGMYHVIFISSASQLGVLISHVSRSQYPGYFALEIPIDRLMEPENQHKELNSIAHLSCDWEC